MKWLSRRQFVQIDGTNSTDALFLFRRPDFRALHPAVGYAGAGRQTGLLQPAAPDAYRIFRRLQIPRCFSPKEAWGRLEPNTTVLMMWF